MYLEPKCQRELLILIHEPHFPKVLIWVGKGKNELVSDTNSFLPRSSGRGAQRQKRISVRH